MISFEDIIAKNEYIKINGLYVFGHADADGRHTNGAVVMMVNSLLVCPYCGADESKRPATSLAGPWWWVIYECGTVVARYGTNMLLGTGKPTPLCTSNSLADECDVI